MSCRNDYSFYLYQYFDKTSTKGMMFVFLQTKSQNKKKHQNILTRYEKSKITKITNVKGSSTQHGKSFKKWHILMFKTYTCNYFFQYLH